MARIVSASHLPQKRFHLVAGHGSRRVHMESGSFGFSVGCDVEAGMAKKRPFSAADYAEIVIQRKGQPALNGEMWVADGLLTVTTSDGRQKTAQVGNSRPAGLARLMLLELEEEHLHGGPLSDSPETTE